MQCEYFKKHRVCSLSNSKSSIAISFAHQSLLLFPPNTLGFKTASPSLAQNKHQWKASCFSLPLPRSLSLIRWNHTCTLYVLVFLTVCCSEMLENAYYEFEPGKGIFLISRDCWNMFSWQNGFVPPSPILLSPLQVVKTQDSLAQFKHQNVNTNCNRLET